MDLDEAQPDLGYLPHVSPTFGPVDHSLPGYPAFLLLLTEHSDLILIIVCPDPPLKPPALSSPSLRLWNTSIKPHPDIHQAPPWLHSANNLMVFQPTDGMADCLLGQPLGVPYRQIWWVSQFSVTRFTITEKMSFSSRFSRVMPLNWLMLQEFCFWCLLLCSTLMGLLGPSRQLSAVCAAASLPGDGSYMPCSVHHSVLDPVKICSALLSVASLLLIWS